MLIPCPNCGPRNASEFRHAGDAPARPDANNATRTQWRSYLYDKRNPAGWTAEVWYHGSGCRQFISVERHRTTNETRHPTADDQPDQPSTASGGDHTDPSGVAGPLR
jgi:heterotetrameric sarcosine oxidase delta subunit